MRRLLYRRLPKGDPMLAQSLWDMLVHSLRESASPHDTLLDTANEVLVVVGNRQELAVLENSLKQTQAEKNTVDLGVIRKPFQPPIVRGELAKDLGTFRREELYD